MGDALICSRSTTPPPCTDLAEFSQRPQGCEILGGYFWLVTFRAAMHHWVTHTAAANGAARLAHGRVISDYHFRKTATEYDRKPGMKWLSCTAK
jgi:hypothetical protein